MRKEILPVKRASFITGALAAVLIAGCSAFSTNDEKSINTLPPATPTVGSSSAGERLPKTDEQIVKKEVKRLGIQLSDDEILLWKTFGYGHSLEELPINEATLREAGKRVTSTIILMNQSKNPHLNYAARFISPLLGSGDASIVVYTDLRPKGAAMGVVPQLIKTDENEDKLHWHIGIDANEVLNNSSGIILAMQLTHEIKHIEDMIEYNNSLPNTLSLPERLEKINQRITSIEEQAQGFAVQALTYIYAYGLGFRGGIGLSHEEYAAEFIRDGSNPNSPLWKNYIAELLTSLDHSRLLPKDGSEGFLLTKVDFSSVSNSLNIDCC